MKSCHCHGNSIKKWKNHCPIVEHLVGLNTADNKLFLRGQIRSLCDLEVTPQTQQRGLAFNPDPVHPRLGTFRVWKPSPPGRAFSRTMWGKPSRARKKTPATAVPRSSFSHSALSESFSPCKLFASVRTRRFLRSPYTREDSKALGFSPPRWLPAPWLPRPCWALLMHTGSGGAVQVGSFTQHETIRMQFGLMSQLLTLVKVIWRTT